MKRRTFLSMATAGMISSLLIPTYASALSAAQEKQAYESLRGNFIAAHQTYVAEKPDSAASLRTAESARAYISSVANLLVARIDSMNFFISENKGLSEDDRRILLSQALEESVGLQALDARARQAEDLPRLALIATELRRYLSRHDRFMKETSGYLIAANLELAIARQMKGRDDLSAQAQKFAVLGADISPIEEQRAFQLDMLKDAFDLLDKARGYFAEIPYVEDPDASYWEGYKTLRAVSDKIQSGDRQIFASVLTLREINAPMRTSAPKSAE